MMDWIVGCSNFVMTTINHFFILSGFTKMNNNNSSNTNNNGEQQHGNIANVEVKSKIFFVFLFSPPPHTSYHRLPYHTIPYHIMPYHSILYRIFWHLLSALRL